jgi:hypothetical protein
LKTFQGFFKPGPRPGQAIKTTHISITTRIWPFRLKITSHISAFSGREDSTAPIYRLFSINDKHPGMIRVGKGETGAVVALEVSTRHPRLLDRIFNLEVSIAEIIS